MTKRRFHLPGPDDLLLDQLIMEHIEQGSRVLDLGCGDGRLLSRLRNEHGCSIQGIERDLPQIVESIAKGVPVIQADLDEGLAEIPDQQFDYVVLSQTLQQVLHPKALLLQMLRVANRVIVVVPNFGHWRIRLQLLLTGRAPITASLPYDWYNTPNLHLVSMLDFRQLITDLNIKVLDEVPIVRGRPVRGVVWPNLRADNALYLLEQQTLAEISHA